MVETPPLARRPSAHPPKADQMRAILDYRVAIEVGAAILASERARPRDLDRMRGCVERMREVSRFEAYRRADIRFHIAMAEAAGSPRIVSAMTEVQGDMSELIGLIAHPEEVLARSNAQHERLVRCLERGDSDPRREVHPRAPGGHRAHPLRPHARLAAPAQQQPRRAQRQALLTASRSYPLIAAVNRDRATYARIRSPFGSHSGSTATSPSTQRSKMSTATAVPGSACSGGR